MCTSILGGTPWPPNLDSIRVHPPLPRPSVEPHWRDRLADLFDAARDRIEGARAADPDADERAALPPRTIAWALTAATIAIVAIAGVAWLARPTTPPVAPEATLPYIEPDAFAPTAPPVSTVVLVHVAGAVNNPGVYQFSEAARVGEAVDAAGGPTHDADVDRLNLAAPLADGDRIYVPTADETITPEVVGPTGPSGAATTTGGMLNINTASATELETLPGIGPATALAIVAFRTDNGEFVSVAELDDVPGIGPAKLAQLQELVTTG